MIYFQRKEFECQCGCGFDTVDYELVRILDDVRAYFNKPVTITGGNRCYRHNEVIQKKYNPDYVAGSSRSKHLDARAADFTVKDTAPQLVYNYLHAKYPDTYGLGLYHNRVHVDSRFEKARWRG